MKEGEGSRGVQAPEKWRSAHLSLLQLWSVGDLIAKKLQDTRRGRFTKHLASQPSKDLGEPLLSRDHVDFDSEHLNSGEKNRGPWKMFWTVPDPQILSPHPKEKGYLPTLPPPNS